MKRKLVALATTAMLGSLTIPELSKPTLGSDAVEQCKLREASHPRQLNDHLFTGFPAISKNFPTSGSFTIAIVPVHYADLAAEAEPLRRVRDDMQTFVEFFEVQSEGRVKFQWRPTERSILLPGSQDELANMKGSSDEADFARRVLTAVDPFVDFTGVHSAMFVLPPGSKNRSGIQLMFPMKLSAVLETREGGLYNFIMAGTYFGNSIRPEWSYWAHELGHAFHLPDLYAQPWSSTVKNIRSFEPPGPFHGWDFMANQDGPSRSINMWLRWVRGWASDSQIVCKTAGDFGDFETDLIPIEDAVSGSKAVVIRFSNTRALVIESRRETRFNLQNDVVDEGVLVYEVDTALGHGEIPIIPVKRLTKISVNLGDSNPPYFDALLKNGQVLRYENIYIKVVRSGTRDRIRISSTELVESTTTTTTTTTSTTTTTTSTTTTTVASGSTGQRSIGVPSRTITCIRGRTVKRVRSANPKCPAGFRLKP